MATAAARLAAVQELLLIVAHHAFYSRGMDALRAMRLVSRAFNAAATPHRFIELRIAKALLGKGETEEQFTAPLGFVRHLYMDRYNNWPAEEELLRRILSRMTRLERFRYESFNGPCLTPAVLRTVATTCTRLESLQLTFSVDFFTKRDRHRQPDLDCFHGLRELSLYNLLIDDHAFWLPQIARLLKNSPCLKSLKLGFSAIQFSPDYALYLSTVSATAQLFDQLCDLYEAQGGQPLRLEALWLLGGLVPYREDSLPKLTDPACLVDVLLSNRERRTAPQLRPERIALDAVLAPARAPRLRWFRVDECSPEILEHLRAVPASPRLLAVSHRRQGRTPGLEQLLTQSGPAASTPALQLRMLALELEQRAPALPPRPPKTAAVSPSAAQILEDLVASSSAGSLEGLAVHAPSADDDGGGPGDRVRLLERALARLPGLAQLSFDGGPFDAEGAVLAEGFARAAPRLQFVHVGSSFWRIWRGRDGEGDGDGNGEGEREGGGGGLTVVLETMDPREADRVELWRHSLFNLTPVMPMYNL
ncbi:hypothetical protein C8A05DRAFT_38108 [Staphylotrichum tortipilum]|uniref:Uncharacterized protein n=1 Tax=Staphylotrichum tortipilum TaxID=2831512 RepID=A0AAN6RP70_9PEZI|nr:hypothetical protein C8A05DRAFT_38108 [Staphylotrichum longicolle]